jgi:hypothetical protein
MAAKWIHTNMFISVFIARCLAQMGEENTIDFIHAITQNYRINLLDIFVILVVYLTLDCHEIFAFQIT